MRTAFVRVLLLAIPLSAPAIADDGANGPADTTSAARTAYAEGAAAYERGDFATAARAFDRADRAVPNATALRYALKAATRADDAVLAMTLAARARRDPRDADLMEAAGLAATTFEGKVGEIELACPPAVACAATVDGAPVPVGSRVWVVVGEHVLGLRVAGQEGPPRTIRIDPGQLTRLEIAAGTGAAGGTRAEARGEGPATDLRADRPPIVPRTAAPRSGLAPAWFWTGVATTGVLVAATVVSGLDAAAKNREFQRSGDGGVRSEGVAAQTRTNVLLAVASGAAIATAAIGLWGVQWSASAAPAPGGASLALAARGAF